MNFIELQKQRCSVDFHQDQFSVILKKIFYSEYERYKILYRFNKRNSVKYKNILILQINLKYTFAITAYVSIYTH